MEEKELFEKYKQGRHWENHPIIYAKRFADFLKKNNFKGLLVDVGCGIGRDISFFKKEGLNVLGIDISDSELETAKLKCPDCRFEKQDVENLNFKANSIDAFFMINVIHYVKKKKALKELLRTLKKNGYLFIHFNIYIVDEEGHYDYQHEESEIMDLISGFKIVEKRVFFRTDDIPKKHTHEIMELILQKI